MHNLSAQFNKIITLLLAGWTMAFLTPAWIQNPQRNCSCYPVLAKHLEAACLPLPCRSQRWGGLSRNAHDHLCSWVIISKYMVGSTPLEVALVLLVSCFKQQLLSASVGRLCYIGFANKTTNDASVEGSYRPLCFWGFHIHVWNTVNYKTPWKQGVINILLAGGKCFLFTIKLT